MRIWLDPFRCGSGWIHCILVGADLVGSIVFWLVRIWLDPLHFGADLVQSIAFWCVLHRVYLVESVASDTELILSIVFRHEFGSGR